MYTHLRPWFKNPGHDDGDDSLHKWKIRCTAHTNQLKSHFSIKTLSS